MTGARCLRGMTLSGNISGAPRRLAARLMVALTLFATAFGAAAWNVPRETLRYNIMYKWGLINKKAGTVTLTTTPRGDTFNALLTGATAKWADRFFMVRDTLKGTIAQGTFLPSYYEKISNEGGDFEHNILRYTRAGNTTTADVDVTRRRKKDTETRHETKQLTATGVTIDMLASYYYMRQIDYASMQPGETVKVNVFSGKQKELLTIHYDGLKDVEVDGTRHRCYHITFTFTSRGGKKSSDNMDAWISTDGRRIPLLLEGKLPVGKVRAVYAGA